MTYDGHDTSQLEVLEVIHLALAFFLRFGVFRIRVPVAFAMSTALFPNAAVHLPRK